MCVSFCVWFLSHVVFVLYLLRTSVSVCVCVPLASCCFSFHVRCSASLSFSFGMVLCKLRLSGFLRSSEECALVLPQEMERALAVSERARVDAVAYCTASAAFPSEYDVVCAGAA